MTARMPTMSPFPFEGKGTGDRVVASLRHPPISPDISALENTRDHTDRRIPGNSFNSLSN